MVGRGDRVPDGFTGFRRSPTRSEYLHPTSSLVAGTGPTEAAIVLLERSRDQPRYSPLNAGAGLLPVHLREQPEYKAPRTALSSSRSISSSPKVRVSGCPQNSPIRSARSRSGRRRTWRSSGASRRREGIETGSEPRFHLLEGHGRTLVLRSASWSVDARIGCPGRAFKNIGIKRSRPLQRRLCSSGIPRKFHVGRSNPRGIDVECQGDKSLSVARRWCLTGIVTDADYGLNE